MKPHRGVWTGARAEAAFRRIEDRVWAERFPAGVDAADVATSFGPTRAYRWSGTGLPVVLLHGIGGTSLMWAPYLDGSVAGGFGGHPVVAIDTMGDVGRSRHDRAFSGQVTLPSGCTRRSLRSASSGPTWSAPATAAGWP